MGDAIRRGLLLGLDVMGGVDWFEYVDEPLDDVRSKLGIVPKERGGDRGGFAAGAGSERGVRQVQLEKKERRTSGSTRR